MEKTIQEELFERALKVIPGGVNSPVRAFKGVGGKPLFIKRGQGAQLWDEDGQSYVDYVMSWGPLIFGHADAQIMEAIQAALKNGTAFGASTQAEVRLAEKIISMVPSIQKVRLVNSGTEATMSALRVARAFTRRERVIKFSGCYHGHVDTLLVGAGSGAMTLGVADSDGLTRGMIQDTLVLPYNSKDALTRCFREYGREIAAVIVEPVAGNMGCVLPKDDFLEHLRALTGEYQALLIFDEVMTGFRLGPGGAQEKYGVTPDLTCLGKIIGGGLPVGAFGGKAEIMDQVAPLGRVYQAGTLSGNPLAVHAGLATLEKLSAKGVYEKLERLAEEFGQALGKLIQGRKIPLCLNRAGSMFTLFFHPGPVTDYESAKAADTRLFARFFHELLAAGVFIPPSQFEAAFLSLAHSEAEISHTLAAIDRALERL